MVVTGISSLPQKVLFYWTHLSRSTKLLILLSSGVALSILAAGVILRQRRRKYRAIKLIESRPNTSYSTATNDMMTCHRRASSFSSPVPDIIIDDEDPLHNTRTRRLSTEYSLDYDCLQLQHDTEVFLSLSQNYSQGQLSDDFFDATDLPDPYNSPHSLTTPTVDYLSDSDDSFESATETFIDNTKRQLYINSLLAVDQGLVQCRTIRTQVLGCSNDKDFLAKLYCVRQAFDELLLVQHNREYIINAGKDIMITLLVQSQQDPQLFVERYTDIVEFCQISDNWTIAEHELKERGVACMNVFDVVIDFMLLDAFDDLSKPPSALVSVIQNGWISDGIKQSMLNTALWSILKTKKSLLKNKDGFMSRFYLLSEILSPLFAWGFLGTDDELHQRCQRFKMILIKFLQSIFSLDTVRYSTVDALSDDIMNHTRRAVHSLSDV